MRFLHKTILAFKWSNKVLKENLKITASDLPLDIMSYKEFYVTRLSVVFICENNHYGMGTSQERSSASQSFNDSQLTNGLATNDANGSDCHLTTLPPLEMPNFDFDKRNKA